MKKTRHEGKRERIRENISRVICRERERGQESGNEVEIKKDRVH